MKNLKEETVKDLYEFLKNHPELNSYMLPVQMDTGELSAIKIINPFFDVEAWKAKVKEIGMESIAKKMDPEFK